MAKQRAGFTRFCAAAVRDFTRHFNKRPKPMKKCVLILLNLILLTVADGLLAQGTEFMYQGQLQHGGSPANGLYDFEFSLFNTESGGGQVGSTVTHLAVGVTDGLFSTALDFGAVFGGNTTWLAISVRSNGVGSYTALTPRQELTPAPYAIFANTASNLSGTIPTAQLSGTVDNGELAHSSITVTAGTGLTGGGTVALGGTITLNATGGGGGTGITSVKGNSDITATTASGAVTLGDTATNVDAANLIVKRDDTGSFRAKNIMLDGALTLPATTISPDIIYFGTELLLYGDNYGNFFAGQNAGNATMAALGGTNNTGFGSRALSANTTGQDNTAFGSSALTNNTSGLGNTAFGCKTLVFNTTGSDNIANGVGALYSNTTGSNNLGIGDVALFYNTSGSENTADGFGALIQSTTGDFNIALGILAGGAFTGNESSNIDIGNTGVAGDMSIIRIGATQSVCYIAGTIYADGFDVYDEKMLRENLEPVDYNAVLAKVAALPLTQWNYKRDGKGVEHIGPKAQDFQAAFQLSADGTHMSVMDEGGVALAAIKGLNQKVEERDQSLHQQLAEKEAEIQDLKQSVEKLRKMVQSLAERK
jgi:hypothetical protein